MTEPEFKALQAKHRREAEEIRAGIKASKRRMAAIFRAGEAIEHKYHYGDYDIDDIKKIAAYAAEHKDIESFATELKKRGS